MYCQLTAISEGKARELVANPAGMRELVMTLGDSPDAVSLEKSWHGLHYVLTGTAWEGEPPLNFLAAGGEPVGENFGYGPVRLLRNDEVRALDAALDGFSEADFDRRFDLRELEANEIYPQIWDEPLEDLKEEYGNYLAEMKRLVKRAAGAGECVLVVLT
jgi:hypothetical protein